MIDGDEDTIPRRGVRRPRASALVLVPLLLGATATRRAVDSEPPPRTWTARWISVPDAPASDYGVYHFRRSFTLAARPDAFVVHVTADNRYQLFVNGERAVWGPARGDLDHWRYETVDLARYLKPGPNALAAVVWNFGAHAPYPQITHRTGFLLQGDGQAEKVVDTGAEWKSIRDDAYRPLSVLPEEIHHRYYVAGPGDHVEGSAYPWGWEEPGYDDSAWVPASVGTPGASRLAVDAASRWMLVPRSIPLMEEHPLRLARVRRASGVAVPAGFPQRASPLTVPARTRAILLLDQDHLATAYPALTVSGGRGAVLTLRYAEALFVPGKREKGHRDEIEGKELRGVRDVFVADGGTRRLFRPLWWRTYRYLQLEIETTDTPLVVEDLAGSATGYPFTRKARLDTGVPELGRILEVGWRTARLCAHETYMDCPYYEQLQYAGDTRIQALVSLYMTGDARLMRNAIEQLDDSRTAEGLTQSRAPTRLPQYIPPFSLWWVGMVHDFWRYQDDPAFVRGRHPGVRAVLSFFADRQQDDGSLGPLPWWNFVDWTKRWPRGVPPPGNDSGATAPLDLQLLLAYGHAADLEESVGSPARSAEYREAARRLGAAIQSRFWDASRGLYADTPAREEFSQHANVMAVLAGLVSGWEARALMERVLSDASLVPCSIYFRHYLHEALNRAGLGDLYLEQLGPWRQMLAQGLTTWAETNDPDVRSDCHAWGASPNFELFRTVLGIDSTAPGFRRVLIRPSLGRLARASGSIPHPRGQVSVTVSRRGAGLEAAIDLPQGVEGEIVWGDERKPLASGSSRLTLTGRAPLLRASVLGWPAYGGGPDQIRYSPLAQINRSNVRRLEIAWTYDSGETGGLQANPIVVDGVLYTTTPKHKVVALDAATGIVRWTFDSSIALSGANRGVTYWASGDDQRIFTAQDHFLYALDARTGRRITTFGRDGRIDLREELGRPADEQSIRLTTPGIVYENLIIVGGRVGEGLPASPGHVRAYDARTGKLHWTFHAIPHPGEPGYETWPKDAWTYTGGANNWAGMAVDEARGIVYVPTGSAAADFYGANRLGDNLFANSLIALEAETGKRLWHFQGVRHDLWDRDFPSPPSLVTVTRGGRRVDAVAQTTKSGHVFLFDRVRGFPLFPIEAHKVPPSVVDGEVAAETQPLPTKPAPFARQHLTEDMLTTRTPEAAKTVREAFRAFRNEGSFVPFRVGQETVIFPGFDGGAEWGGSAFDPETAVLYVNANEMAWTGSLAPNVAGAGGRRLYLRDCASCHRDNRRGAPPQMPSLVGVAHRLGDGELARMIRQGVGRMPGFPTLSPDEVAALIEYMRTGHDRDVDHGSPAPLALKYRFTGYKRFLDPDGYPAIAPPWGTLTAIDLNTGAHAWQVPLGEYPALVAQGVKNTGSENYGGPVVTAGGLVFIGATSFDKKFRAFDKATGKLLWEATLPFSATGTPATYEVDGRQFVVVPAGGGKDKGPSGGVYVAFALP